MGDCVKHLEELVPVKNYLNRINAQSRTLTKAVVIKKEGKYWQDTHIIRFNIKTGDIEGIMTKDIMPTEQEVVEIRVAILAAKWPVYYLSLIHI